jgi:hypothetical protein
VSWNSAQLLEQCAELVRGLELVRDPFAERD